MGVGSVIGMMSEVGVVLVSCVGEDPLIFLSLGLKSALWRLSFRVFFSLEDILQA